MDIPLHSSKLIKITVVIAGFLSLLCVHPFVIQAQSNFNINVNASVISSIELITLQSITLSKAEAVNNVITINPRSSGNAGKMVASGTPNSSIQVTFIKSRQLSHSEGSVKLTFNYTVAGNDIDDQSSSEFLGLDSRDMKFNNEGKFYLWIGGNIDISTALPGNYQGEFSLEIEYI